MKYLKNEYKFIKYEKSNKKDKKYIAILENKKTGRRVKIHFGGIKKDGTPYPQYKDKVLGMYSKYDTNDKKRRELYRSRHSKEVPSFKDYWSAGYFSYKKLW
tara:strand:+ start:3792 stop:4097 length:306 start_codon:yes stop_codon:yes gene_type:complete